MDYIVGFKVLADQLADGRVSPDQIRKIRPFPTADSLRAVDKSVHELLDLLRATPASRLAAYRIRLTADALGFCEILNIIEEIWGLPPNMMVTAELRDCLTILERLKT